MAEPKRPEFAGQIGLRTHAKTILEGNQFYSERFCDMNTDAFANLPIPVALVVDDEPLIRTDTSDMVADEGYHVLEARTADEAFAFLNEHSSLKLLVTDVQMPGEMDGLQLAAEVSARWPEVSIIVASGAVKLEDGSLPASARFIAKPISSKLVKEALEELGLISNVVSSPHQND
jgi:CheY-like chemotaxis protein